MEMVILIIQETKITVIKKEDFLQKGYVPEDESKELLMKAFNVEPEITDSCYAILEKITEQLISIESGILENNNPTQPDIEGSIKLISENIESMLRNHYNIYYNDTNKTPLSTMCHHKKSNLFTIEILNETENRVRCMQCGKEFRVLNIQDKDIRKSIINRVFNFNDFKHTCILLSNVDVEYRYFIDNNLFTSNTISESGAAINSLCDFICKEFKWNRYNYNDIASFIKQLPKVVEETKQYIIENNIT